MAYPTKLDVVTTLDGDHTVLYSGNVDGKVSKVGSHIKLFSLTNYVNLQFYIYCFNDSLPFLFLYSVIYNFLHASL